MNTLPTLRSPLSGGRRLGFHYYPDTLHYRETDLDAWVPVLQGLGAAWLVLLSETGRAIPEAFLTGLLNAGIEPIIHFKCGVDSTFDWREARPLFEAYARWGVRYVICYDRPNARSAWPARSWVQQDLAKIFLDRFLPAANLAIRQGMVPIFPPLEPGGSYWDTAFLRSALQGMVERQEDQLLRGMALAAYAWTGGRSLNWGAGGPERWPQARPYHTPPGSQDQRGLRIFDWYQAVAQDVLGRSVPIFLLQVGTPADPEASPTSSTASESAYARGCAAIARLLFGEPDPGVDEPEDQLQPIPPQVVAGCFWLLAADADSRYAPQAWFQPAPQEDASAGPWVETAACAPLRALNLQHNRPAAGQAKTGGLEDQPESRPLLRHYLLLPGLEWGISDWYLELARPFIKKHRPAIGFSIEEARLAARVTVVGQVPGFTREVLDALQQAGRQVEWIDGDGTTIATRFAEM
mgnify:CR=1 FL=1